MMNAFTHVTPKRADRLAAAASALRSMLASRRTPPTIDGVAETTRAPAASAPHPGPDWLQFVPADIRGLVASHLPPGLESYLGQPGGALIHPRPKAEASLPDGAQFLSRTFSNPAGSRPYKLYVPSGYAGQLVPLVVMLHGCTQSPDDFAAGTGMNAAAEEQVFLVVYPGQTTAANPQKCWKWFSAEDQQRGAGEPSLIAGITRQVMQDYSVNPQRVYVAGLSAGGAAAAIMGQTYPDLYAAIGVHSGLACGAATDLPSALAVMKRGNVGSHRQGAHRSVPAIVFHGDRDHTVNVHNGEAVAVQALGNARTRIEVQAGQDPGGHSYTRTIHRDESGQPASEQWLIHGAGHAWSGGSAEGSYTDPRGPDATREMLRFFREHPHPAPRSFAARP